MKYFLLIEVVKTIYFLFSYWSWKFTTKNLTTNFGHEFDEQESGDKFLSLKFFLKILVIILVNRNLTTKIGRENFGHEISRPVGHQLD